MVASTLRVLQILLFACFLAAPLGAILVTGFSAPYEQRSQTRFPTVDKILMPESAGREQLADAVFERSALRRIGIGYKNAFMFDVLHFADTPEVVSGAPAWLFYRQEFDSWSCDKFEENKKNLEAVILLGEIADAANLPFLLAIAPNKASVERNEVSGRAALRAGCYFKTADMVQSRIADARLRSILHHTPLVRSRGEEGERYFKTDTHWLPIVGFEAAGDLMHALGRPGFPEGAAFAQIEKPFATDMRRMLLMSPLEVGGEPDLESAAVKSLISANAMSGKGVTIIHDSFYERIGDYLARVLPEAKMVHVANDPAGVAPAVKDAQRLIISSVERFLLSRIRADDAFGWMGPIGRWVLDGADRAADQCLWNQGHNLLAHESFRRVTNLEIASDGAARATSIDPQLEIVVPSFDGASTCLRLEMETPAPGIVQLYFQARDANAPFFEQRSIGKTVGPGRSRLQLILPASAAGEHLRIDPVNTAGNFTIIGLSAAPGPAAVRSVERLAATTKPLTVVVADSSSLANFLIVPDKGESGKILSDQSAFEARSRSANRLAVGDGDGVVARVEPGTSLLLSGRKVRVTARMKSAGTNGSPLVRAMFSRSGAQASSGWQEFKLSGTYATYAFDYVVPFAPPTSFDFIGFWTDPEGKNRGVDIASVLIETID